MPDEITEQQAVKIAEWTGAEVKGVNGNFIKVGLGMIRVQDWISSPQGEVAMMDRAIIEGNTITFWPCEPDLIGCEIIETSLSKEHFSKTRNQSLQLAILEMLGRKIS